MEHWSETETVLDALLILYMVAALCWAWLLIPIGVVRFVLACMGRYSWSVVAVLACWCFFGLSSFGLDWIEGVLFTVAVSPAVGLGMVWLEGERRRKQIVKQS